jgi:hypothetical protein
MVGGGFFHGVCGQMCVRGSAIVGVGHGARCKLAGASSMGSWPSADRRAAMAGRRGKQRVIGERRKKGCWAEPCAGPSARNAGGHGRVQAVGPRERALLGQAELEEGKSPVLQFCFSFFKKM